MQDRSRKIFYQIVTLGSYYGCGTGTIDINLVEGDIREAPSTMMKEKVAPRFTYVLAFHRVSLKKTEERECSNDKSSPCLVVMNRDERAEIAFLQWCKILNDKMLLMNQTDKVLR